MQLSDDDIQEFIEIWKKEFGETISVDDARRHATQLLTLFRSVARDALNARGGGDTNIPPP